MSAVRLKLLPMLAFTKQHKTYVQTILPRKTCTRGHFISYSPRTRACPTDTKRRGGRDGMCVE